MRKYLSFLTYCVACLVAINYGRLDSIVHRIHSPRALGLLILPCFAVFGLIAMLKCNIDLSDKVQAQTRWDARLFWVAIAVVGNLIFGSLAGMHHAGGHLVEYRDVSFVPTSVLFTLPLIAFFGRLLNGKEEWLRKWASLRWFAPSLIVLAGACFSSAHLWNDMMAHPLPRGQWLYPVVLVFTFGAIIALNFFAGFLAVLATVPGKCAIAAWMMYGNVLFHMYLWTRFDSSVFTHSALLFAPIEVWFGLCFMTIFGAGYTLNRHWQLKHELV